MFAKYHYLSHSHNNASDVYVCTINDQIAGFISTLHFPHPVVKNMRKIHRLVIKPDYQGIGLGGRLIDFVSDIYKQDNKRVTIVTSAPSLIFSLKGSAKWVCTRKGRSAKNGKSSTMKGSSSNNRITVSFEYIGIAK